MKVILQRVSKAEVTVDSISVGKISAGILVLVGFEEADQSEDLEWMIGKILKLRIFNDENELMNLSLLETQGELLVISQFTLYASTKKGNRPSYIKAAKPEIAEQYYQQFIKLLKKEYPNKIECGIFGANMQVELINDGPVTISIDSKQKE